MMLSDILREIVKNKVKSDKIRRSNLSNLSIYFSY